MAETLQLRISSGTAKNKKLEVPDIPNMRPVQEIAKQAIFSIIGDQVVGATCSDLFAGSGNMGIEALSRGAAWCDFVDNNKTCLQTIEKNLFNCDFSSKSELFYQAATKFAVEMRDLNKVYDLIFIDPFYDDIAQIFLLKQIPFILNDNGKAILLYGNQLNIDTVLEGSGLQIETTRQFGASHFSILTKQK